VVVLFSGRSAIARQVGATAQLPAPPSDHPCGSPPTFTFDHTQHPHSIPHYPPRQATFLRSGGDASAPASSLLEAELEGLGDEELELRCRRAGVSRKGGRSAQISRLLALDAYLHGDSAKAGGEGGDAPAKVAAKPTSAWAEVGADAAEAQGPKSKWELQDDEQPAAAGAAAAAPAAAADREGVL